MTEKTVPRGPGGRPRIADQTSQIPPTTVSTRVHDAVVSEAFRRDVSVAQVVRDALVFHLKTPIGTKGKLL
jgi:hypothetical protein